MEPRPLEHLRAVERDYGRDVWRRYERLVADVRADGTSWPSWCHAPMAAAYAILSGGGTLAPGRGAEVGRLAALAAWRTTKGIYRYDPELIDALWSTPLDGAIRDRGLVRYDAGKAMVRAPGYRVTAEGAAWLAALRKHGGQV